MTVGNPQISGGSGAMFELPEPRIRGDALPGAPKKDVNKQPEIRFFEGNQQKQILPI